jgi:mannose-6-phosphate isomerase-like protein (cupin superfamily)
MADYTIENLKELENSAERFGFGPGFEARFATRPLECEQSGLSYQRLPAGGRSAFGHRHHKEEELYVIVGGGGRVRLDDDVRDVRRWDTVRVSAGVTRAFEAGPDGIEFLVFGAPGTGSADVEMVPGWWSE